MHIIDGIVGSFWGYSLINDTINFTKSKREWKDASAFSDSDVKVSALKQKTILSGIKASSSLAYSLTWAAGVKWISLGRFMPVIGAFALAGRAILLTADSKNLFEKLHSEKEREARISASLELLTNVLTIAYYVFAVIGLGVQAAIIITTSEWLLVLSFISLIVQYSYNSFVEKQKKLNQAQQVSAT